MTRARDALAAERRRMPWLAVEKDYAFIGPECKMSLLDLFDGRRQLLVKARARQPQAWRSKPPCTNIQPGPPNGVRPELTWLRSGHYNRRSSEDGGQPMSASADGCARYE